MSYAAASPSTSAPFTPQSAGPSRAISLAVIHCTATPSGQWLGVQHPGVQRGAHTVPGRRVPPTECIDAWHALRGFARVPAARARFNPELAAIGYHYVIDLDGLVHTGRHPGEVGAHALGHNLGSLGICLVGGAEPQAAYSAAQWQALTHLVRSLVQRFGLVNVLGHLDLAPDADGSGTVEPSEWLKTCPGFAVREWVLRGMGPLPGHVLAAAPSVAEAPRA